MKNISYFFVWLFFILALFFTARCFCSSYHSFDAKLSAIERDEYMDLIEMHERKAEALINVANDIVWYLPESSDKERAKMCFATFISGIASSTPHGRMIAMLAVAVTDYGLQCLEEYQKLQICIEKAKYHYEMAEFYERVLIHG